MRVGSAAVAAARAAKAPALSAGRLQGGVHASHACTHKPPGNAALPHSPSPPPGFNPGSTIVIANATSGEVAGRAAVCTTLSGAAAGLVCLANAWRRSKSWDLASLCNGVLVGFVSITAGAHVVEPWAAIIAGMCGALVSGRPCRRGPCHAPCCSRAASPVARCMLTPLPPPPSPPQIFDGVCWVFLRFRIDDPLSAAPMHGFCGAWAVFFVGLLAKKEYVVQSYGTGNQRGEHYGAFYPGGGGRLLASQIIAIIAIAA